MKAFEKAKPANRVRRRGVFGKVAILRGRMAALFPLSAAALVSTCLPISFAFAMPVGRQAAADQSSSAAVATAHSSLVHRVALVGAEDRETEAQWTKEHHLSPKQFHDRFGASGQIECWWWLKGTPSASASLTCRDDIISTNAHVFMDEKTGALYGAPSQCSFVVNNWEHGHPVRESVPLTDDMVAGVDLLDDRLTNAERLKILDDGARDWAVIRLRRPARGVTPYEVWKVNPLIDYPGNLDLIARSAPQMDKRWPTIARCHYHDAEAPKTPGFGRGLGTDCDSVKGGSGGADLRLIEGPDGKLHSVLVSIHGRSTPDNKRAPYDLYRNSSYSVLVEKKLEDAFVKMCGAENISPGFSEESPAPATAAGN
jgi:hypothetical protein